MRDDGFTLIEMMFVIAVIGILAAVAVVAYTKNVRKARAGEIPQIFGELKAREEMYHAENAKYLPVCPNPSGTPVKASDCDEGDYFPATLPGKGERIAVGTLPQRWLDLRVNVPNQTLYCQYEVIAGPTGDKVKISTIGQGMWGSATPTRNWFYLVAQCNWDDNTSINALYWQRDDWSELGVSNESR